MSCVSKVTVIECCCDGDDDYPFEKANDCDNQSDNVVFLEISDCEEESQSGDDGQCDQEEDDQDQDWESVGEDLDEEEWMNCRRDGRDQREKEKETKGKGLRRTYVNMPTGKRFAVTVPVQRHYRCSGKLRLVTLRPHGIMGKREYTIVRKEMEKTRRHGHGGLRGYQIIKIQKVVNCPLWRRFRDRQRAVLAETGEYVNEQMLFHGSNRVKEILKYGFDDHNAKGGDLGKGIYFAKSSAVANEDVFGVKNYKCDRHQYKDCTKCTRRMLLCRVTLGKGYEPQEKKHQWTYTPNGYHSMEAVRGRHGFDQDEHYVDRGDQAYPEYVITYRIRRSKC